MYIYMYICIGLYIPGERFSFHSNRCGCAWEGGSPGNTSYLFPVEGSRTTIYPFCISSIGTYIVGTVITVEPKNGVFRFRFPFIYCLCPPSRRPPPPWVFGRELIDGLVFEEGWGRPTGIACRSWTLRQTRRRVEIQFPEMRECNATPSFATANLR